MAGEQLLFFQRTKYIAIDANNQGFLPDALQNGFEFPSPAPGQVMTVHRLGK